MRTARGLRRFLTLLLALVMALGLFPLPAGALGPSSKTRFSVSVQVADKAYAGTDSDIYLRVYYVDGTKSQHQIDTKKHDDFERKSKKSYIVTIDRPYWCVKGFSIYNSGKDAMCIQEVWVEVYTASGSRLPNNRKVWGPAGGTWVEKSEYYFYVAQGYSGEYTDGSGNKYKEFSQRQVQSGGAAYNTFRSKFSGAAYIGPSDTGDLTLSWGGKPKIDNDGTFADYNPYEYEYCPTLTFKYYVASKTKNGWVEADKAFGQKFTETQGSDKCNGQDVKYTNGLKVKKQDLYNLMKNGPYYAVRIDSTLTYPSEGSTSNRSETVSYYVYRPEFELGTPKVLTSTFSQEKIRDQYFFNASVPEIKITVPVLSGGYFCNYENRQVAKALAGTNQDIRLWYTKDKYLKGSISYDTSRPDDILLTFPVTANDRNNIVGSGSSGMKLSMKDLTVQWTATDENKAKYGAIPTYSVSCAAASDNGNPVVAGTQALGAKSYYANMSLYKLDNVSPVIDLSEPEGSAALSGKWQKTAKLFTAVADNEKLFPIGDNGSNEGLFRLRLLDGKGNDVTFYEVKGSRRTESKGGLLLPVTDRTTEVALKDGVEAELSIELTGRDIAGNEIKKIIPGLRLDTKAPEVSIETVAQPQNVVDKSRVISFNFNITEASGTGMVKYCFYPQGSAAPAENSDDLRQSGVINSLIGQWCFIQQSDVSGATVQMKLNEGEGFDGYLVYYAKDEAGNVAQRTTLPVNVNNLSAECEVEVAPYTHPLPSYDITFTPGKDCVVYYRWSTPTGGGQMISRPYVKYEPDKIAAGTMPNPGSGDPDPYRPAEASADKLDGLQVLEYYVENRASGNIAKFEGALGIPLVFDNTPPDLSLTRVSTGSSLDVQTFNLTATDTAGIASARYTVSPAGNDTIAAKGNLELTEGTEALYAVLSTGEMNLPNGNYVLTLYATDQNGVESALAGEPFSIRTLAPTVTAELKDGKTQRSDPAYAVTLNVSDLFSGTPGEQSVYWRSSTDGVTWSDWTLLCGLTAASGTLTAEADLASPAALAEGLNQVYLQVLCAENGKNMKRERISPASIVTLEPLVLLLDDTAPTVQWTVTCERNRTALTGTLTAADDFTAPEDITVTADLGTVTRSQEYPNVWTVEYEVPANATQATLPEKLTFTVTDGAGNAAKAEAFTAGILDLTGPVITQTGVTYDDFGGSDRQDAYVTIKLTDALPETVTFTCGDPQEDKTDAQRAEAEEHMQVIPSETVEGEYTVVFRGFTGNPVLTVTAQDDLGNQEKQTFGPFAVKNAAPSWPTILSAPAYAQDTATLVVKCNVPALVVAAEETAWTDAERDRVLALVEAAVLKGTLSTVSSCMVTTTGAGEGKRDCGVWVVDGFGNAYGGTAGSADIYTLEPDTVFGKTLPVEMLLVRYTDGTVTNVSPDALVAGTHVADPSVDGDTDKTYTASVIVGQPYNYYGSDGQFYLYAYDETTETEYVYLKDSQNERHELQFDPETYDMYFETAGGKTDLTWYDAVVYPYTILTAQDERTGTAPGTSDGVMDGIYPEDYDDKGTVLHFDPDAGGFAMEMERYGFHRMVFNVVPSAEVTENLPAAKLNVGLFNSLGGWSEDENDYYDIYIRQVPDYGYAYCTDGEGAALELIENIDGYTVATVAQECFITDIWMNQTLNVNVPIITVQPELLWSWRQDSLTPQARLDFSAAGHGAEIKTLKLLKRNAADTGWDVVAAWSDYAWTVADGWEAVTDPNAEEGESASLSIIIPEAQQGKFAIYGENVYGLSTLSNDIDITVISTPITAGDFSVDYVLQKAADEMTLAAALTAVQLKDEEGNDLTDPEAYLVNAAVAEDEYAAWATVRLTIPAAKVAERNLYVRNAAYTTDANGDRIAEVRLSPESETFTFQLADPYGYTRNVTVGYGKYDVLPPTLGEPVPDELGKTNKPYGVTITAADGESGIASVTLTGPDGAAPQDPDTGKWVITRNGSYLFTATDRLGNVTKRAFSVNNIDTTAPTAAFFQSLEEDTQSPVVVNMTFSKPNVTILRIEPASESVRCTLDKGAKTLTYTTNGAVTVFFMDEYGNVGQGVWNVNNIYTKAPEVSALCRVASDELSVSVTFEMTKDDNGAPVDTFHKLEDLTVIYNGQKYNAAAAEIPLLTNGVYTFMVMDQAGLTQLIKLEVKDIDREAPKITEVTWTYKYLDEQGAEHDASFALSQVLAGKDWGAGYRIADDIYHRTGGDVTVTVTTDKDTAIMGSQSTLITQEDLADMSGRAGIWGKEHELVYRENGLYVFNLEKHNGRSSHYGVDVEIIDKTPPVIELTNGTYLMYIEGRDKGSVVDYLTALSAWDTYLGVTTDLSAAVQVDFGGLDASNLENNVFDKNQPYTVTYSVKDAAGNETRVTQTVILVSMDDVLVTVNGKLPNASFMAEADMTEGVTLGMINFAGTVYCTYAAGMRTMGQMKTMGTLLKQENGVFQVTGLTRGWYTFFVQTATRDYFNIYVFVS